MLQTPARPSDVGTNPIGSDDAATWTITTDSLSLKWRATESGDVQLTSLRTADKEWIAAPTAMFSLAGEPQSRIEFRNVTGARSGSGLQLTGTLHPLGLTAMISCTVYDEHSTVHIEIEVKNETDEQIAVGSLTSLRLSAVYGNGSTFGVLNGGRWDEGMPPRGYRLQTFDLNQMDRDKAFGAADDGRSSGEQVPWFTLGDSSGGLFASLVWSGRWRLDVDKRLHERVISFGISEFEHLLGPGERLALPGVVLAGYSGDIDDGANAWRRWVVNHWMSAMPENWPWVQYNHWYAYGGDIDAERLLEEAQHAAEAGCEVFVIDDGWFRGRRPDSYVAGWGDWVEDRAKFPNGLHAFGESIRDLGMKFGLWVEPERADDNGDIVQQHPDWVATRQGVPISRFGLDGAEGVHMCLGNPAVQQWMAEDITRVVREYGVDWLKWDYNIGYGMGCDADHHGHQSTDGHYAHTLGLYRVFEELRSACPDLVIENCASGGHRVDLGALRHSHTNWVSDYTHRAASCRQHVQGAGLFLPLQHLNSWAQEERSPTEFRSRMGGAFGVSSFLGEWSQGDRDMLGEAIAEYKRLRPYLSGDRFLLTGPLHQNWDVWQFVHPSGADFVVLAFRESGETPEIRVAPRVPSTDSRYIVERSGAEETMEMSGTQLASDGITIHLPEPRSSEIIWVTVVE